MANAASQIDTRIEIVTPENIAFQYRVAGPFRRLPAYLLDLLIRFFAWAIGSVAFGLVFGAVGLPGVGLGASLVLAFLMFWFYGGFFETYFNGQTPGKRLMQIRVVTIDGQPINGLQAVLRNLLRTVDAQPLMLYQLGLAAAMMNDRFQRLGDLACGTMVVIDERGWFQGVVRTDEPEVARLAGQIPANFQASRTLGRALAAYVQRRRMFALPRRMEIARHLGEPLRQKFDLPADTNFDLLLCAVYQRTFIADRGQEPIRSGSPFRETVSVIAELAPPVAPGRLAGRSPQAIGATVAIEATVTEPMPRMDGR